jgi:hypothetical protein
MKPNLFVAHARTKSMIGGEGSENIIHDLIM